MASSKKTAVAVGATALGTAAVWNAWKRAELRRKNRAIPGNQHFVIVGAGFAGLKVAQELARLLPEDEDGQITLVDRNGFLLFTPMLTEVAGGELEPRHIVASPRKLSPRINFEQADVHDIDVANRSVVLDAGPDANNRRTVKADQLVIALGSVPNYHGIPGLREHSLGMKSISDAIAIRNHVLWCLERANWEQDAAVRRELLTFVIGGGGYTGVETMAAINDMARTSRERYPKLPAEEITTIIVEPGDRLLAELSPDLASYTQRKLEENRVRVLLNSKITSAAENYVELEHAQRIPTRTLVWAGGVTPNPLIAQLDCKRGRHGGMVVDETCAVPGRAGVWAIGDCAEIPKRDGKGSYAPTAQNATREGTQVARNIVAVLRGERPQPFVFTPLGELALIGRHSGVAKLYGRHFSGFLAWAMWRAVYISKMPGMSQRSRIVLDWLLDAVFGRNLAEVPADRSVEESHA